MPLIETNEEKGKYLWTWKEYVGDVLEENRKSQQTVEPIREGALGRRVARVPITIYRMWEKEFRQIGGNEKDRDWKVFLWKKIKNHPEYRTVPKLKTETPYAGNIFVK